MRKVSQEVGVESVTMAEEMAPLAAEMSYLDERRIAFENLGEPGLKSIRSLTTVLSRPNATARRSARRYGS